MSKFLMTNDTYDFLKWIVVLVLPALGTFYFALAGIWGFPYGEQVIGTIAAVTTCLGAILQISNSEYKKAEEPETDE